MDDELTLRYVIAKYPNDTNILFPTYPIDFVWRTHMCTPIQYKIDINVLIGVFLQQHDPNQEFTKELEKIWKKEYGGNEIKKDHFLKPYKEGKSSEPSESDGFLEKFFKFFK